MQLLKITDIYGRTAYASQADYTRAIERRCLFPMRARTGTRLDALPAGFRPDCTMMHPDNVAKTEEV